MINLQEIIIDSRILAQRYIVRDGFVFTCIDYPANIYDAIVIKYPPNAQCFSPTINVPFCSLDDQICFINNNKIEKALIIADNIDFITKCPTLKHIRVVPSNNANDNFDYSPLYKLPEIKALQCTTAYGKKNKFFEHIDCSKINGLQLIHASDRGIENYNKVDTLRSLGLTGYEKSDLHEAFCSSILHTLSIYQSKIKTLEGIQNSQKIQCVYLHYNRHLQSIDALSKVKKTLKALRIENCSKIEDFSILGELENLELLELSGSNEIANLDFIKKMKHLKTFIFNVNVKDGDISPCLKLSYAYSEKSRKHYNLKDSDLPKGEYIRGNENLEKWFRLE